MIIGYARTSTTDQKAGLEAQRRDLKAAGCEKIFEEEVSSVDKAARVQLEAALDYAREGDVLVVSKLDRLARSVAHLLQIVETIEAKGASLRILDLSIDTATPMGRLMLTTIGGIAQFEREIMLERQREGIAKAKADGKYKGRKPTARAKAEEINLPHTPPDHHPSRPLPHRRGLFHSSPTRAARSSRIRRTMANTSSSSTTTPSYRRAYVQPREITRDRAFTVRDIREDHVRTLYAALRNTGRLDPVLVWEDLRDPGRPRLVLLDGQHSLAAYENQRRKTKVAKGIPVRIVSCDEITAHRLAAQRNSHDKLPLTFAEKMNLAWRLVWLADAVLSKADIVGDTGASRTTVHNMRQRRRAMVAAGKQPTGEWWRDSKEAPPEQPEETDVEARIAELAETLKRPAEAMRREPAAIKWRVLERVFGTYEARQFAWHGLNADLDEFSDDAVAIDKITVATGTLDEDCDF